MQRDGLQEDGLRQEDLREEDLREEDLRGNGLWQEDLREEDLRENGLRRDDLREDVFREDNYMQKKNNINILVKELEEKLDWYITEASEEEYDEKAVEYILYLLNSMKPSGGEAPRVEDAWKRFEELVERRQLQTSVSNSVQDGRMGSTVPGYGANRKEDGCFKGRDGKRKTAAVQRGLGRTAGFLLRHRMAAAMFFTFVVLAISGTARTIARRDTGFFQWLKQDETGKRMITSPESLDEETDVEKTVYYEEDDLPEWTQEWLQIINKLEVPSSYEWKRFEINRIDGLQYISSYYLNKDIGNDFALGVKLYLDKISYNSGIYDGYNYIDYYNIEGERMDIYSKTEESGITYYIIFFIEKNCQYFVFGEGNLDETKVMASLYRDCVKNNL